MELRRFAERVLLGNRLEDKLVVGTPFSDRRPGDSMVVPYPARPAELAFPAGRIKDVLPGSSVLHRDEERGRLLHRFANHELLALEIMAATLLRFPDAPAPFRLGLAATMAEEQLHLGLYLSRMRALGVQPGEIPVNDYFWRCMADIATPFDYAVRMALCFEQANLDFTLKYQQAFVQLGDNVTASILQRVYDDEVGHVRLGLHFFRMWKPTGRSDWEAFEAALPHPLSPARAKAEPFDRAGRERAGFDGDFVANLSLYVRSRGRPPLLHTFNPGCESEVGSGKAPSDHVSRDLRHDLAPLLCLGAAKEDVVECPTLPGPAWSVAWIEAGFTLPERVADVHDLSGRKVGGWRPWGHSPVAIEQVSRANLALPGGVPSWNPEHRRAYSKVEALAWRARVIRALDAPGVVAPDGAVVTTMDSAVDAISRGWMLKAPFSTAGRERLFPPGTAAVIGERERAWVEQHLSRRGELRAEPVQRRVLDLSFHFDLSGESTQFKGICAFRTTASGQFVGTSPGRWRDSVEDPILRRFLSNDGGRGPLPLTVAALADTLDTCISGMGVRGPVGIDAMVVDTSGVYQLDPFVELNPRLTMGRLSLTLDRRLHPRARGAWDFLPVRTLEGGALAWFLRERAANPLRLERGLIRAGVVATNDPANVRRMLTVLRVT